MRNLNSILTAGFILFNTAAIHFQPLPEHGALPASRPDQETLVFEFAQAELWTYLRLGLNYLESPKPLQPPETIPPAYKHPDGQGFGAYGFSPAAYADIQQRYPYFRTWTWEEVLHSPKLYDLASQAFADWLLKNLQEDISAPATRESVFDKLHQAWNLGLSGFKKGRVVASSRLDRAEEFKAFQNSLRHLVKVP